MSEHFAANSIVLDRLLRLHERNGGHIPNTRAGRRRERILIGKAQAGDEAAREYLLAANAPMIVNLVKLYTIRGIPADDRANAALMGYSEAISTYNIAHHKRVRLATWALPMARYRIQALKRQRYQVSIPHNVDLAVHAHRKRGGGEIIPCKSASKLTISAALQISEESMDAMAKNSHGEEMEGTSRNSLLLATPSHEADILDRISTEQAYAKVERAMELSLTEREKRIMRSYYLEGQTMQGVADANNLSRERIRQIIDASILRIQWALDGRPFTHTIKDREARAMTGSTKGKRKDRDNQLGAVA